MIMPEFRGRKHYPLIFADCAVNIAPTPEQLADIAIASERSAAKLLGEPPRVAMLSFSTHGSAAHACVDHVTEALAIARERAPEASIDGEFQADAALMPAVAAKKVKRPSAVAGQANVLIFPDLNSGNIAYKLTQYLAGAQAIGPFLQGFAQPISDLSRGASVDDIVATTAVCLAQAAGSGRRMKVLVVNCGSSSIKYQLFEMPARTLLAKGMVERIGEPRAAIIHQDEHGKQQQTINTANHDEAMVAILHTLMNSTSASSEAGASHRRRRPSRRPRRRGVHRLGAHQRRGAGLDRENGPTWRRCTTRPT